MARCQTLTMLQDPKLTGDLLLLAVGMSEFLQTTEYLTTKKWSAAVCQLLGWESHYMRMVVRKDVPRFEAPRDRYGCDAQLPVAKRRCGRSAAYTPRIMTAATGEWVYFPACTQHRAGVEKIANASRIDWERAGKPKPAPNTGGALAAYFTNMDALYEQVAPRYQDRISTTVQRPRLQLIQGGI